MEQISVIVPVYNVEKYLDRCIESILRQTYSNIQLILVDDGSSDQSGHICDKWSEIDARVKVIHQENKGVSSARNCGIKEADGAYIGFCDADDYMDADMYETLYNSVAESHSDIAMVSLTVHKLSGEKIHAFGSGKQITLNRKEAIKHFLLDDLFCYTSYCHLIKASLCKKNCFEEGRKVHEDRYFTFQVLMCANKIVVNDICKYHYVLHKGSVTMKPFGIERLDVVYFADNILSAIEKEYPDLQELANFNRVKACLDVYKLVIKDKKASKTYKNIKRQMKTEICQCKSLEYFSTIRKSEIYTLRYFEPIYIMLIRAINLYKKLKIERQNRTNDFSNNSGV